MSNQILLAPGAEKELNRLAREQMKQRILKDILFDMQICKLEGWDCTEYIKELQELLKFMIDNPRRG